MTGIDLPPPPAVPEGPALWATAVIPLVGSLGTLALVVGGSHRQMLVGIALAAATVAAMGLQIGAQWSVRRRRLHVLRERYRQALDRAATDLLDLPHSPEGMPVRIGYADRPCTFTRPEDEPTADPVCIAARDRFIRAYATLPRAPYAIDLTATPVLAADADHARAIVLAAATTFGPDELRIDVRAAIPEPWSWIALLPHHGDGRGHRLVVTDLPGQIEQSTGTTTVLLGTPATTYVPDRCGPAEAAARARRVDPMIRPGPTEGPPWTATLGRGPDGPVALDLRESAEGGVGPHGLLIGATGSGKSELLRHVLGELVATHRSEDLRLALIDYKGGAAFALFEDLPHTTAYVTNLTEPGIARRLAEALEGELTRRQRELADAGVSSVREHPLPRLLIVVDEFAELLGAEPAMADLFGRIGRLGRSLGIHLLLSTQRLDDGRMHALEAHLSFRIAMRTFTAAESRLAIGTPLAAELPHRPGSGLLAAAGSIRPFTAPDPATRITCEDGVDLVSLSPRSSLGRTLLEDRVRRAAGAPAPPLWLPPLGGSALLTDLPPGGRLQATIGWIDRPREQRIDPFTLDLTGAGGHVAVVGAPRSGKSTTLRTVAAALRRSTPGVRLLGVDLTGGLTGVLPPERLATARTPDRVDRLLRHLKRVAQDGASPPVVVLIDGWGAMRDRFAWVDGWHQLAERGLAADIHLVVATHRWSDLRPSVRDLFGSRVELRLGDPLESEIDRRLAASVPLSPGHGLVMPGLAIQVAIDSTS